MKGHSSISVCMGAIPYLFFGTLSRVFDFKALCVLMQEVDSKMVEGWTCACCPCLNNGRFTFHKLANRRKALVRILELRGCGIKTCKGIIPFANEKQYHNLWVVLNDKNREDAVCVCIT